MSRHFLAWCIEKRIDAIHIQPGKPTQNACIESFNGRLRDECYIANPPLEDIKGIFAQVIAHMGDEA